MSDLLRRLERELEAQPEEPVPSVAWEPRTLLIHLGAWLVMLCCVLELGWRVAAPSLQLLPVAQQEKILRQTSDELNKVYKTDAIIPGANLLWTLKAGSNLDGQTVAAGGWLGAPPNEPPLPRQVRVVVMSDQLGSTTYRPFPAALARLARLSGDGPRLDVVNGSVPGYSSEQYHRLWPKIVRLHPHCVALTVPAADARPALGVPDRALGWDGISGWLLRQVAPYSRLVAGMALPEVPDTKLRSSHAEFLKVVNEVADDCRAYGFRLILVTHPAGQQLGLQEHNESLRTFCRRQRIPLLDLEEDFARRDTRALLTLDHTHLTAAGHNLLARMLFSSLHNVGLMSVDEFQTVVNEAWYDSTAPDRPDAEWTLTPTHLNLAPGTTATVAIGIRNTGNTRLLSGNRVSAYGLLRDVDLGGIQLHLRWRTVGAPAMPPGPPLPLPRDIFPGEEAQWTTVVRAPDTPGDYAYEAALVGGCIGPLEQFGAHVTTGTLSVR